MSRLKQTFAELKARKRVALVPYITAGDPNPQMTVAMMHQLVASGADVLELGVPFSDPMADGPAIQRATERALAHGVSLRQVLDMVAGFRQQDSHTPVVLMGYANPVERMGYETFAGLASVAGVDGVLLVDIPPEEAPHDIMAVHGLDMIFLLSPTTTGQRMQLIAQRASGFVYYVSLKGVTGSNQMDLNEVEARVPVIRNLCRLPVGVGFGIRDAETAQRIARFADAVVIGSRIIEMIEQSPSDQILTRLDEFVGGIRSALDAGKP